MTISVETLNKIKNKVIENQGVRGNSVYRFEHKIAKAYLLDLFDRFPLLGDNVANNTYQLELHLYHFMWVRGSEFKEGNSPVNTALAILPKDNPNKFYLNRQTRFETERSVIQKLMNQLMLENSLPEAESDIPFDDLSTPSANFYKLTENPCTSFTGLSEHVSHLGQLFHVDKNGYTLLHHAAAAGDYDLVNQLISLGLNVNAKTTIPQDTPLTLAVRNGHIEVLSFLLEAKNINANDVIIHSETSSDNALSLAIWLKQKEAALMLLAHPKVNANEKYSYLMVRDNQWHEAPKILSDKVNTPLMKAVLGNDLEKVKELLALPSTDPNAKRKNDNNSALDLALDKGYVDIVFLFLANDNVIYRSSDMVHFAIKHKLLGLLKAVFEKDKLDDKSGGDLFKIMRYWSEGNESLCLFLINQREDVNITDAYGYTPLLYSILRGWGKALDLLLQKGAYVNVRASAKDTPLTIALENKLFDVVEKLIAHPSIDLDRKILYDKAYKTIDEIAEQHPRLSAALKKKRESTTVSTLRARITALEKENAALKKENETLKSGAVTKTYLLTSPTHNIKQEEVPEAPQADEKPLVAKFLTIC
jgi:ankyrin repeat protein